MFFVDRGLYLCTINWSLVIWRKCFILQVTFLLLYIKCLCCKHIMFIKLHSCISKLFTFKCCNKYILLCKIPELCKLSLLTGILTPLSNICLKFFLYSYCKILRHNCYRVVNMSIGVYTFSTTHILYIAICYILRKSVYCE